MESGVEVQIEVGEQPPGVMKNVRSSGITRSARLKGKENIFLYVEFLM